MVALYTQEVVTEAGYEVVGPAFDLDQAKQLADTEDLSGAILDINLGGEFVWPVAEILEKREVGFFFLTGFNSTRRLAEARDLELGTRSATARSGQRQ